MRGWRDLGVASRRRSAMDTNRLISYVNDCPESRRKVLCFVAAGVYLEGLHASVDSIEPPSF
jgi:hypothetical protein